MSRLAELSPSHQLAYFKQAMPDEAKSMLYQHRVETVQDAIQLLTELYEPERDSWLVTRRSNTQKPGERLRVLGTN